MASTAHARARTRGRCGRAVAGGAILAVVTTVVTVVGNATDSAADFSAPASPAVAGNYPSFPQPVGVTFTTPSPVTGAAPVPVGARVDWQRVGSANDTFTTFVDRNNATGNAPRTTVDFSDVGDPRTQGTPPTAAPTADPTLPPAPAPTVSPSPTPNVVVRRSGPANPGQYTVTIWDPSTETILHSCTRPEGCFTLLAAGPPELRTATPNHFAAGSVQSRVTFAGSNFARDTSIRVLPDASGVQDVQVVRDDTADATSPGPPPADGAKFYGLVTLSSTATPGLRDVQLTNTDGQTTTCTACFSVLGPNLTTVSPTASTNNDTDAGQILTVRGPPGTVAPDAVPVLLYVGNPGSSTRYDLTVPGTVASRGDDGSWISATYDLTAAAPGSNAYQPALTGPDGALENVCTCRFSVVQTTSPVLSELNPRAQRPGTTQQVTATGSGFARGTAVNIAGGGVTTTGVEYVSRRQLRVMLAVSTTAVNGKRDVTIIQTDGSSSPACRGCYTISNDAPILISPTPSPSTTATSTPTPTTPGSSPSGSSPPPDATPLAVALDRNDIRPTEPVTVAAHGAPGSQVELWAYSRPATTYRRVRAGTADSQGNAAFTVQPGTNTRLYAHYAEGATQADSASVVITVHTALSLSAYRDGVRRYQFQGRNLPQLSGQLITLYRIDGAGREIRTATTHTDGSGIWRIDRTFTASGTFAFVARTSQTYNNAAGRSNERVAAVH
jgi:hypothetical protein